jgi:hypothetical protein
MLDGRLSCGAVVSRTVTGNEALALLPAASLAVHVTVVTPRGNVEPEPCPAQSIVGVAPLLSVALIV